MQIDEHLERLAADGPALADAAGRAGLDADVPSCPDWHVRDLLQHVGQVHRWALSYVTTGRTTPPGEQDRPADPPADEKLLAWFRDGHRALTEALAEAPENLGCWSFLPAASPRAFWARRQAHETAIHRADAELAAGDKPSYDALFAADGIDELLFGFFARPRGRLVSDPPVRLGLRATDIDAAWTMTIGPDSRETTPTSDDADCVVAGPASALYLLLWNRADTSSLDISGDERVATLWRDKAHITWR